MGSLVTGNDTQFTSALFQEFCSTYGFTHVRTSLYYPQANGFIERTVQTVKNLFQKFRESGADPHLAMLCLCSTPLDHNIASPAELREYQANLPSVSKPGLSLSANGDVNTKLQAWQDQHKSQYDRSSKPLPTIHPDGPVCVCSPHNHKWEPGIVAQRPLIHIWSPWQMAVPSGEAAVIFGQQERKFVSRATSLVMNHRHP